MEKYTITLTEWEDGEDDSELDGYHFPSQNITFALQPDSGIFTVHTGKPAVIKGHGRAWSCCRGDELKAFAEFYDLWQTTGEQPADGEYFSEET